MEVLGNLIDTTCYCTFSCNGESYALCLGEAEACVCVRIRWNPWHGYRYYDTDVSEEVRRAADRLLSLASRFPEKYRMAGEHYTLGIHREGETLRYRIRKERPLSQNKGRKAVPLLLRLALTLIAAAFSTVVFFSVAVGWLSFLFPEAGRTLLFAAVAVTETVGVLCLFFLFRDARDALSLYCNAFIPIGTIILLGMLFKWKWLWLLIALLAVIALVSFLRIAKLPRRRFRKKLKDGVYLLKNAVLYVSILCMVLTYSFDIYPHTYESGAVAETGVSAEALERRYSDACAQLTDTGFSALTPQEKIDVLQAICDYESIAVFGCNSAKVCAAMIEDDRTAGYYTNEDQTITIDLEHLKYGDTDDIVRTLLHETRHHYQHRLIDLYRSVEPNLTEDNRNMSPFKEAKAFLLNFEDYQEIEWDGYDAYYEQLVERDSRGFAEKRMNECYWYLIYQ